MSLEEVDTVLCNLNGASMEMPTFPLTYSQYVRLAGKMGRPTVTYKIPKTREGGSLTFGDMLTPVEGMIVNVMHTTNG